MQIKRRYRLSLWILLLIVLNVVVYFYDYQTEPTQRLVYKLDEASLNILQDVKEPIIITFYESDNLTPPEQRFADKVRVILEAYKKEVGASLHLENINPLESLDVELEATNSGIQSIERKGDGNMLRKIFLGLIIQVGGKTEVLPVVTPRMSIEYLVSSSLRKLTEVERRKIAMIQGHGELTLSKIGGVEKRLRPNYLLDSVVLNEESSLWQYQSALIIAPSLKYTDAELDELDAFLDSGKNIFIALDRVEYDDTDKEGYKIDTRLEAWLVRKGLIVHSDFIVDNSCGDLLLSNDTPPISFPYFPQISNFPPHVATQGIRLITLRYASSIEPIDKVGVTFTPLAITSEVSGKKSLPLRINLNHEWTKGDYLFPKQIVAAILEGNLGKASKESAKIVVVSDGDLVLGDETERPFENHIFVANVIDWLSDASGLAALKQKGITSEIKEPEVKISTLGRYLNLFIPVAVVGIVALFFYYRRKRHIDKLRTAEF